MIIYKMLGTLISIVGKFSLFLFFLDIVTRRHVTSIDIYDMFDTP